MVRTMEWKLCQYVNGEGELYNVRKDPNEINNLYGHSRYIKIQLEMTQLLATTMMENQDNRKSDGDHMGAGNG